MAFELAATTATSTAAVSAAVSRAGLTHEDFLQEWNWCWIAQDVEAAAELGRTLLERNRELESTVRQQQAVIDDQTQEMQYLSKQNRLLRQAAESRLRLCEQLEASVAECERAKLRLRHQLDAERQRHITLKMNMEAAEERGDELQRLLDASRAAESQSRCLLRSLQQQRQQQLLLDQPAVEVSVIRQEPEEPIRSRVKETTTVCRLVDDLAEVEERLHLMETDWMEEKRKRIHLESEVMALQQENQRLHQETSIMTSSCSSGSGSNPASLPAVVSLSLSEELLISSNTTDFSSAQWRDAWDNSGPLSLIGSGRKQSSEDEELSSDSSSSGFSDEHRSVPKATQTDPVIDLPVITTSTFTCNDQPDVKSLFRELFAVIKQNI